MFSFRSSDLKLCVQCALLAVATSAVGSASSLSGNGKCIFLVRVPSKATSSSLLLGHSTVVHADTEKQHAVASLPRVTPGHRLRRAGHGGGRRRRHIRRPHRQPPRRRQGTPVILSLPLSLLEKRILSVE